ncbi:MAG: GDSL-type esterase/lipase family protein [Treponema sp.]|jgi:lysophospholipase L1-like esterase|nr:GDSL-type esterase/lipase family protein [Treponema sp.]
MKIRWIVPVVSAVLIIVACLGGWFLFLRNIYNVQGYFKRLPYDVRGYPQGEVLLIGSSIIEYWRSSEADLGPLHTVNVGIGGTRVSFWVEHISALVKPFAPRAVIMQMGSNNIHGGEGSMSGDEVAAELAALFETLHRELPGVPLYYISILPSFKRQHVWDEARRSNLLVAQMAEQDRDLFFIDCAAALLTGDGNPKPDVFANDGLHLNPKGYTLWTGVLRPKILGDLYKGDLSLGGAL